LCGNCGTWHHPNLTCETAARFAGAEAAADAERQERYRFRHQEQVAAAAAATETAPALTIRQAATLLGTTMTAVRNAITAGEIPADGVGSTALIPASFVRELLGWAPPPSAVVCRRGEG
jgi:excisionase family DNA binding protein